MSTASAVARREAFAIRLGSGGQTMVEYLLMMLMLLFLFTGLYRVLSNQVKHKMFVPAGKAILRPYY
ncbi:MAG: hypothetical protein HY554_13370 [Elusimicrobia bacterium]|nr:hypothetical protein [Elusimicrobiota bacterium]